MKIINGDCLVEMKRMEDDSVDHVLTSPPYGRKRNDKIEIYFNYSVERLCETNQLAIQL